MKNFDKYEKAYFMPPECTYDWVKKDSITKPPIWCSVDLRDGNQALIEPMSLDEKLQFFQMLVDIGFKEIEVGFPAASETEYEFMRALIEKNMIPDDVTVQVLTQAREHIIKKTFEAVKGAPHAVIHLYNSTSVAQREQVFKKSKEQIKQIAVDGAVLLKKLADETEGNFSFQYSPESFPGTEVDYAVDVCNAVLDVWKPKKENNGERTGNVDIVTLAMNMYTHGVDPKLDFSNMPKIRANYEKFTRMHVYERQPYAGDLVFTAFSGSHQDAIAKGMQWREDKKLKTWSVPYLPVDPKDVGRTYDGDVIRINSQSGKGGVNYILKQNFGISMPDAMREEVGYLMKHVSDEEHKELSPQWVYEIFEDNYINPTPYFQISECHFKQVDGIMAEATITCGDKSTIVDANGNGRLDAVSNTIKQFFGISYQLSTYEEHTLTQGSSSKAIAYVSITCQGDVFWGVGIDEDIISASIHALCVCVNKLPDIKKNDNLRDERLVSMINFMQANYQTVTLEDMAEQFHLSVPYLSKFIHEKSGKTFGEQVTNIRMKKAKTLLKNGNMTVENIAAAVGYPSVEHFSRTFKKLYDKTPVEYRNSEK